MNTPGNPVKFGEINTLHELLEIAILDFQKVLLSDKYHPNMNVWHEPVTTDDGADDQIALGMCEVCLAGSVMAMSLQTDLETEVIPDDFDDSLYDRLQALNDLRCGQIGAAYSRLADPDTTAPEIVAELTDKWEFRIPYETQRAEGREEALSLLNYLKEMLIDLKAASI